jgi:hypothetical protein
MRHLSEITAIAKDLTAEARNPYRKILAIQNYLRNPRFFTYSDRVNGGHGADDILHFLTVSRTGYCEQFAGSMAVLLRALGIPARVAVGFTPGISQKKQGDEDVLRVTTQQAHAWVEVLFPKYGWLAFEPTPSRFNAVAAPYAFPLAPSVTGPRGETPADLCLRPVGPQPFAEPCVRRSPAGSGVSGPTGEPRGPLAPTPTAASPAGPSTRVLILLGVLAAALLILAAIPLVKLSQRRLILRRAHGAAGVVLASFRVLDERAADVGLGRRPSETLREYGARLSGSVHGLDRTAENLTALASRAAYSENGLSSDQAEQARSDARRAARLIRRSVPLERRVFGTFRLPGRLLPGWGMG